MVNFTTYEQQLKDNLQNILRSKGLVDSGALFNSIDIKITDDFQIEIISEDYLVYLEEEREVLKDFSNSNETQRILEEAFEAYIINKIEQ